MLIRDLSLSKELNLTESKWSDTPKDFYSFVLLKIKNFFNKELKNNKNLTKEEKKSYKKLALLENDRKLVKRVIMTIPYNATLFSITKYIKENFNFIEKDHYILKNDNNIIFNEIDFQSIRKALIRVLFRDYTGLKNLIEYLKDIAKISNELDIQIPWILPSGLRVQQRYNSTRKIKVKPFPVTGIFVFFLSNEENLTIVIIP